MTVESDRGLPLSNRFLEIDHWNTTMRWEESNTYENVNLQIA